MGKTIEELQRENRELKERIEKKKRLLEAQRIRNELKRENQKLLKQTRNPQFRAAVKRLGSGAGKATKQIGKGVWNTLQKMEETRIRNEALQRRVRRQVSKSPKKKTTSKKKTTKRRKR